MSISWSSISAGTMTAAVSLGTTLQQLGASASAAAQTVTAGGLQAMSHGAATAANQATLAATTAASNAAATLPQAVDTAAVTTAKLGSDLSLVAKPATAMATAIPRSSLLMRTAGFLSKALPIVTIGASALSGARIVNDRGAQALINTKDGRGAVLGAVGGALLLVPHPATQLAAAGVLGAVAVNQFGGMHRLDKLDLGMARSPATRQLATAPPLP